MFRFAFSLAALLWLTALLSAQPGKGNRLAYLDEVDPYYPSHTFPKLTTPMWVGEKDVEAVVILGIDDMKDPKKYETYLRPILRRLKEIDGRAPVSIMTCAIDPKDPQLQTWLKEGLSLECHTFDHPCPFFKGGFDKAKGTYEKCVDLLHEVPNSKPVAFRVPCCDSMNTPSPRFYAEIFNKTTAKGNFLQIDTSVFNVFTSADPELPKKLVLDETGNERFTPYLPKDRSFVNWITNYPYPYVIGRLCWQFPCMTPSDWQAQHRHKPNNPKTVEDWKAALDCTVIKQGVFCMVFHPHGWIRNDQVVEFIDYAVQKHGKKVRFLNFREAVDRLHVTLLGGRRLRDINFRNASLKDLRAGKGEYVAFHGIPRGLGGGSGPVASPWLSVGKGKYVVFSTPKFLRITTHKDGWDEVLDWEETKKWERHKGQLMWDWMHPEFDDCDAVLGLRGAGNHIHIGRNKKEHLVFALSESALAKVPFSLPPGAALPDASGKDNGLRFLDLDGDGNLDIIFSNEKEYGVYLFENMEKGWSRKVMAGKAGTQNALPPIAKNGSNNGFWAHSGHLWWANEDTVLLKDHVDRRSIKELLAGR